MKVKQKILRIAGILVLAGLLLAGLITMVYSDRNNHYVVNVGSNPTATATITNENDQLEVHEAITQSSAEVLDYTLTVSNKKGEKTETQVALVVDTSYSMQENGADAIAKATAGEVLTEISNYVSNLRFSLVSNNGVKQTLLDNNVSNLNTVKTKINSLPSGESQDCNNGLTSAYNSFNNTPKTAGNSIRKYILYITDSTDSVSERMQQIITNHPEVQIISILVDLTSSEYMNLDTGETPTNQYVYVLPTAQINPDDILPANAKRYNKTEIRDLINLAANDVVLTNVFSDQVIDYFTPSNITVVKGGEVANVAFDTTDGKKTGYTWNIGQLKYGENAKISFKLTFKKDAELDAGDIFVDRPTNASQIVSYNTYDGIAKTGRGTDGSVYSTASTTFKICRGYNLRIKAVNESDTNVVVPGIQFRLTAVKANGDDVQFKNRSGAGTLTNPIYTTDQNGYIILTEDDADVLRDAGEVSYYLTPLNAEEFPGYEQTDSLTFRIISNKRTREIDIDKMGAETVIKHLETDARIIEVEAPITTTKFDIVIKAHELDNSGVVLSDCEFELIQPKLNTKNELIATTGKTDSNGDLVIHSTVMTKNGTYYYKLSQISSPTGYISATPAEIQITFDNGRVVAKNAETGEIKTVYNENVKAKLTESSATDGKDTVEITVENECLRENAIRLQINLSDEEDPNIKIGGVEYLIETHTGTVRTECIPTNDNGQINTEIYGTGYITLKITERSPKVGYQKDPLKEKEIYLLYRDGVLSKITDNGYGAYTTDFLRDTNGDIDGLQVNLTSKRKKQQNIVRVKLREAEERDVSAGMDIIYDLVDENGTSYGPKGSDGNGELVFTVGNESHGTHTYQLIPRTTTIPSEYDLTKVDTPITIDLHFDEDGFITNLSDVTSSSPSIIEKDWIRENDDSHLYNVYDLKIAYYLKAGNTFRFNVLLRDEANRTTPIDTAKYNINIEYDTTQNGETITKVKKITNRQTNAYGKISTLITKSDRVVVYITEVSPKVGFTMDNTTQEVHFTKRSDGRMILEAQTPYDLGATNTNGIDAYKGVRQDTDQDTFVYEHYNRGRNAEDTYVNMTITKEDLNGAFVDGVLVRVRSDTLLDGNNNPLNTVIATGSQVRDGRVVEGELMYDYNEFINGLPDAFTIRVPNIKVGPGELESVYEMDITEVTEDALNPGTYIDKTNPDTKIKVRLIFRVKDNNIKLTNVETIYGNRLVKHKEFSSCSDDDEQGQALTAQGNALGVYLANIMINTYTRYEDVGNLSIDFKKHSIEGLDLPGAEYDVKIVNPDSTVVRKHMTIDNGEDSNAIELKGVTVNKDSVIYLTETKAPIGFAVNKNVETLLVTDINDAGEVTLEHVDSSYSPARVEWTKGTPILTSTGGLKENYFVNLIDYQMDSFVVGVNAIDSVTNKLASGFEFNIKTTMGAQSNVVSGGTTKVGSNPSGRTVTYTIKATKTGQYYKAFTPSVNVNVVFDEFGNVIYWDTMSAQTDPNYGTLWKINDVKATATGNLIIDIYVEHQPALTVKVNTINSITDENYTADYTQYGWYVNSATGAPISYAEHILYQVTPSAELPGTGTGGQMYPGRDDDKDGLDDNGIKVGYVVEEDVAGIPYTMKQTKNLEFLDDFFMTNNVKFRLAYQNGKIDRNHVSIDTIDGLDRQPELYVTGDHEITINLYVEPKVPFEITNKEYFFPNDFLKGSRFNVTEIVSKDSASATTDDYGLAKGIYCSTFGVDESKVYRVQQTASATGYADVEDFFVKVDYNADKSINDVTLIDVYGNEITDNRFITVGFEQRTGKVDTVTIEVLNYPEFKINITDLDRRTKTNPTDPDIPVSGTVYKVTSTYKDSNNNVQNFMEADSVVTNADGLGIAHLNRTKASTIVTYKIQETKPGPGYQTISNEFEIEVTFDSDGFLTGTPTLLHADELSNIASISLPTNPNKARFEFNLELKNNPLLKINIATKDRASTHRVRFDRTDISDDDLNDKIYELISFFKSKAEDYKVETGFPLKEITYEFPDDWDEIKQVTWKVSMGIDSQDLLQTLIENKNRQEQKAQLEAAGDPAANDIVFLPLPDTPKTGAESYEILKARYNITQTSDINDEYKMVQSRYQFEKYNRIYVGNVQNEDNLQDFVNKGLTFPITVEPGTPVQGVGYKIVGMEATTKRSYSNDINEANVNGPEKEIFTDYNGQTTAYMNRTIENIEITYKIQMTTKGSGYEWLDDIIELKVLYDAEGKILQEPTIGTGHNDCRVIHFDPYAFTIDIDILVDEVKEFGINLSAVDTYDPDKKIDNLEVRSFLVKNNDYNTGDYGGYFITGRDDDGDGKVDIGHGEDYQKLGQYVVTPGASQETRILRLSVMNPVNNGYYVKDDINLGYYKGNQYYEDALYQQVKYQYLISVTFDDEGKIVDAHLLTGLNSIIGWLVDGRYIQTEGGTLDISHTDYKLNITMKFFPMLELKVDAMDNYFKNEDGTDFKISGGRYNISTQRYPDMYNSEDEFVTAGYIGYGYVLGYNGPRVLGEIYNGINTIYAPIENNYTRKYFVYEEQEPTNYQQHADREGPNYKYRQRLVAIISLVFDELGEIDYGKSIARYVQDPTGGPDIMVPIYYAEDQTSYLVDDNLKEYDYKFTTSPAKRASTVTIGYALTTKIIVNAIDDIEGTGISNIRMFPFVNNTYKTRTPYEYVYGDPGYRPTNASGTASWEYWGAAAPSTTDKYIIGSARVGQEYNGYYMPSDLASATIGGSGNAGDYYGNFDVTYGNDGRIEEVKVLGHDTWGDPNAEVVSVDTTTGTITINMKYSRKFQTKVNKIDFYDKTKQLQAKFDVVSDRGLQTSISSSDKMKDFGKVYADTTVKYTLTETQLPKGYFPVEGSVEYTVTFDEHGNISKSSVNSSHEYFGEDLIVAATTKRNDKPAPDLEINIKNKEAFGINIRLIDKFYKNMGIPNVNFEITNNKGDRAAGNPQTDANGYVDVIASPTHNGELVKYYISQTNTANGYYPNNTVVELDVLFDEAGKIQNYSIVNGSEVVNNFNGSDFLGKRYIDLEIMNMPQDVMFGLHKYDRADNSRIMSGVGFSVTKYDMTTKVETTAVANTTTDLSGNINVKIDDFEVTNAGKIIKYTVHETASIDRYRKANDIEFIIRYNEDGSIGSYSDILDMNMASPKAQPDLQISAKDNMINFADSRVHVKLDVPNDDRFDIYIVNRDKNVSGFGIEGSTFNVSVNGTAYTPGPTDNKGLTTIEDLEYAGEITIDISQIQAGPGYRTDSANQVTVNLNKGTTVYSLDLDPSQDGYIDDKNAQTEKPVTIVVSEEYGIVYVVFENETKTELTLLKQDYADFSALEGAVFEITAQQINDITHDPIGDPITITTEDNSITDGNGKLYFDLGVAPRLETWEFTIKEITPPNGYDPIADMFMIVTYDQYGRIKVDPSENRRLAPVMETNNINCRSIIARVYNGNIPPAYTVKVYKKDADTNIPVSGAKIYMNITEEETGNLVTISPKTPGSAYNGQTTTTGNLGLDYKMYTDDEVARKGVTLIGRGLTYIDNINDSFDQVINIEVAETETPEGYIFGDQKVNGNVKIRANYIPSATSDPTVDLELVDPDGLDVAIDNVNKEVNITIKDESQVKMHIKDIVYGISPEIEVPGISYEIEAFLLGTTPIGTFYAPATDSDGLTEAEVGKAYPGEAVLYRLRQTSIPSKCQPLGTDIDVLIWFGSDGKITNYKLTNPNTFALVSVEPQTKGNRDIYIKVRNKVKIPDYKVQVEKHVIDDESNTNKYNKVLEGAEYEITIHQKDNGKEYTTLIEKTDALGMIDIPELQLNGTGDITVTLRELSAPTGYTVDSTPRVIELYRDPNTGNLEEKGSNVTNELINTDNANYSSGQPVKVVLKPFDKLEANTFTLSLEKYSSKTGMLIEDNHAKFDALLVQEDDQGNALYEDIIGEIETNNRGKIEMTNLNLPSEPGVYKLILTEIEAPTGYVLEEDPIEITLTIDKDAGDFSVITNAVLLAKDLEGNKVPVTEENRGQVTTNVISLDYGYQFLDLDVTNNIIPGYKVQVEKHVLDEDWDLNAYDRLVEGATYRVHVHEEDAGTEDVTFEATSDENGLIDVPGLVFNGFGYVTITIQELSAPEGYTLDGTIKICRIYRDPKTGNIDLERSGSDSDEDHGVNYDFIGTDSERYVKWEPVRVILKPVDKQIVGKFTLNINKYDSETQTLITKGHATFSAKLVKEDTTGKIVYEEFLDQLETTRGKASLNNLSIPEETGEYKLILTELQAPLGYGKLGAPIEIVMQIDKDQDNDNVIKSANTSNANTTVISKRQLIVANIANGLTDELAEDEYSLDITKVDALTNEPIEPMALFKVWLPDPRYTAVYTETSQTLKGPGKLDYCYIEEDKDYTVRLTHLNQPTSAGTVEYKFREVVAPDGYSLIKKDLILTIDFQYDDNGKLYYANATSSDPDYLRINTVTPAPIDQSFSVDILNYEGAEVEDDDLYLKTREYLIGTKPVGWEKGMQTQFKIADKYLWKIPDETTLGEFIKNLDTNATKIELTRPDSTLVGMDEYVGTEMKLTLTKGAQKIELTTVVIGDAGGDGIIELDDYAESRKAYWGETVLSVPKFMALDLDDNGEVELDDMRTIKEWVFQRM